MTIFDAGNAPELAMRLYATHGHIANTVKLIELAILFERQRCLLIARSNDDFTTFHEIINGVEK